MDGGLLSLKWNNHRSTFFYVLSNVRKKECYTDCTLACDGKFYPVHKLVLSTCSEYFEQMFEQTQCKHPVIVLKDIRSEELESLLSYMYVGEVNVVQEKLSGLIKAAECLRIKGLAVPDEEPCSKTSTSREKRSSDSLSSEPKRRRQDDGGNSSSFRQSHSNNRNDDRRKSLDHSSSSTSNKFRNTNSSSNVNNSTRPSSGDRESGDRGSASNRTDRLSPPTSNNQQHSAVEVKTEEQAETSETEAPDEVTIDEPSEPVKQEPVDLDAVYLSDSNSASEAKDILMDNFGDSDGQQHFMDELLGQNSGSDQGNMGVGDYNEGGEGLSSAPSGAGSQQQQHMVAAMSAGASAALWVQPFLDCSSGNPAYDHGHISTLAFNKSSSSAVGGFEPQDDKFRFAMGCESSQQNEPGDFGGDVPPFHLLDSSRIRRVKGGGVGCPLCPKISRDNFNLRDHYMASHSREKPLSCSLCPYKCIRKKDLTLHYRSKHADQLDPAGPLFGVIRDSLSNQHT